MKLERYIRIIAGTFILASLAWNLGESQLVLVHRFRRRQSLAIRLHQVVPDGRHPAKNRRRGKSIVRCS